MSTPTDKHTPTSHNTQAPTPNMLAAALWWAGKGWAVGTGHEPLIDDPRGYRCTCEAYRHSDRCKDKHPHLYLSDAQHCDAPGKHPRGLQHGLKDFTTDPGKIRAMWRKYPNANILGLPGSADCITLDADSYKPEYAGNGLTADELNTPINLSGNGGEHLIFRKHPGAIYSNRTGNLPDGIDVRGDDGYIVLPPSLHYSGNRYKMKPGYEFSKVTPQLLPQRIHDILTAATEKATRHAVMVADLAAAGPRPDLAQWALSDATLDRIHAPADRGHRSEHDYSVVLALLSAGASHDDIHAVFAHYPVGTQGKYSEAGTAYLARTITNAGAWLDEHPHAADPDAPSTPNTTADAIAERAAAKAAATATACGAIQWARTADFSELIPLGYWSQYGYQTGNSDKRMFVNVCATMARLGKVEDVALGFHLLAERAGCSTGSVRRVIERLEAGKLLIVHRPEKQAWRYTLPPEIIAAFDVCRIEHPDDLNIDQSNNNGVELGVQFCTSLDLPLVTHAAHDIFCRSLSNLTPEQLADRNAHRAADDLPPMKQTKELDRRLAAAVPSVGPGCLRVVDALFDATGQALDLAALAERLHMSRFTIRRNVSKLLALGLVEVEHHTVTLRDDWREMSDALADVSACAGARVRRRIARLDTMIFHAKQRMKNADPDAQRQLNRRIERARAELQRLTGHDVKPEFVQRHRRTYLRWDLAEMNAGAKSAYEALRDVADLPTHEQREKLTVAGWTPADLLAGQRYGRGLGVHA